MKLLKNTIFLIALLILPILRVIAQTETNEPNYRVFDAKGNVVQIGQILEALKNADVVFLGEQHDDPTAHALQLQILQSAFERYGKERNVALSMEMFERDVQHIVDEYLQDLINENNFIASSRAWNNYKSDYKSLVEFAKQNKLAVVAANAPRRYVNRVSRLGKASLDALSPQAKLWLAPLPYAQASPEYAKKFGDLMGGVGGHSATLLEAQSLWDATMAYAIAEQLKKQPKSLIVHLNGGFHSEKRLGAPEHLLRYQPTARIVVVTIKSAANYPHFDKAKDENAGDFVILTDPKLPRSLKL
jgi:uncharacterized iron-regulated protein